MIAALFISALLSSRAPDQIDWNHPYGNPVKLIGGGLCVGLGWVKLLPGEVARIDYGPDFNVYRVHGPRRSEWGVYSGFAAQVAAGERILLRKDGVAVHRAAGKPFQGYFVEEKGRGGSSQNHFFGNIFKDTPADGHFFDRVSFGSSAKIKCEVGAK